MSDLAPEITAYYAAYAEESRLATGAFQLEFERTKEIFTRVLPPPPARVVDVGGAAGAYSFWLAERGYDVHLVDASPRLGGEATPRNAAARAGPPPAAMRLRGPASAPPSSATRGRCRTTMDRSRPCW